MCTSHVRPSLVGTFTIKFDRVFGKKKGLFDWKARSVGKKGDEWDIPAIHELLPPAAQKGQDYCFLFF